MEPATACHFAQESASAGPSPPRSIHLLQKVWAEFWRQAKAAALVLALFLLGAWALRGRAPWAP